MRGLGLVLHTLFDAGPLDKHEKEELEVSLRRAVTFKVPRQDREREKRLLRKTQVTFLLASCLLRVLHAVFAGGR